jgi:hypothetical protein
MVKSGIEMIEEILDKVNKLDKRLQTVEDNMKILLSRANNIEQLKPQQPVAPKIKPMAEGPKPSIDGVTPSVTSSEGDAGAVKAATNTIKVMGKIKNQEGKALIGVNVTVVKENGEIAKKTKTNRAGDWMSFLPVGRYKARYFLDKMINTSVAFTVKPEQKLVRISQPKWE